MSLEIGLSKDYDEKLNKLVKTDKVDLINSIFDNKVASTMLTIIQNEFNGGARYIDNDLNNEFLDDMASDIIVKLRSDLIKMVEKDQL